MQLQLPNELPWQEICSWMGYPSHQQPDPQTISLAQQASKIVLDSAQPRGIFQRDGLYTNEQGTIMWRQMPLLGEDIGLHLKHCTHAVWMAVTIGTKTEMQLRRIAKDVALSYAVDAAAGLLAEKLADQLQAFVQEQLQQGEYMTIRYSPGYGDFPIEIQRDVVRMLDTQKQMGLTVNSGKRKQILDFGWWHGNYVTILGFASGRTTRAFGHYKSTTFATSTPRIFGGWCRNYLCQHLWSQCP